MHGGWRLCAFDRAFALEVAEVRQMFELAAIERFASLPRNGVTVIVFGSATDRACARASAAPNPIPATTAAANSRWKDDDQK